MRSEKSLPYLSLMCLSPLVQDLIVVISGDYAALKILCYFPMEQLQSALTASALMRHH